MIEKSATTSNVKIWQTNNENWKFENSCPKHRQYCELWICESVLNNLRMRNFVIFNFVSLMKESYEWYEIHTMKEENVNNVKWINLGRLTHQADNMSAQNKIVLSSFAHSFIFAVINDAFEKRNIKIFNSTLLESESEREVRMNT